MPLQFDGGADGGGWLASGASRGFCNPGESATALPMTG